FSPKSGADIGQWLEFRRVLFRSFLTEILSGDRHIGKSFCVVLSNEVDRFPQSPPDSDVEPLGLPFLDGVPAVQEVSDRSGDRACCVEQGPPLARHLDASPVSGEQRHSELLFQVPDLARQRWLGDVQTLGGSGKTSLLYDRDECTSVPKAHRVSLGDVLWRCVRCHAA